ncbi:jhy protein [Clarias magur]|uniref:Jhy protein n=1 Tax=Clarias magur TaxID=1594786 RepID=A0A8J4XCF7_CLAMG|nr:jhy protein [Clarias magur]
MESDQTRDAGLGNEDAARELWDSLESDTESLVQEKAYQRELQERTLNGAVDNRSCYNDNSHNVERSEHEEGSDPQPEIAETRGGQNTNFSRPMSPWDEYAELRYDPDWRKKLAKSTFLHMNVPSDLNADPGDTPRHRGNVSPRERNDYLIVRSPLSSGMDTVHPEPLQSSFHLHLTEDQERKAVPESSSASLETTPRSNSDKSTKVKHGVIHQPHPAGILPFSLPRQRQQAQSQRQHDFGENQSFAQEQNTDQHNVIATQRRCSQKVRPTKLSEDIVERNKATLGMNNHKQGSYLKAYEQRGGRPDDANQPLQSAEDAASTDSPGSPDNALNPELMWMQKTQKLKSHNQGKQLERARRHHHRSKPRGHMNRLVEKQRSQSPSEKTTLSPPDSGSISQCSFSSAPTANLNINLNTPARFAEPFINADAQKRRYTLALPPLPQERIRNDEYNSRFKEPSYTVSLPLPPAGSEDQESIRMTNKNSIRISPTMQQFQEQFASNNSQPVVHYGGEITDSSHTSQTYMGPYTVLPPISQYNTSERNRPEETLSPLRRSCSEGYLAQLKKQKQIQAKTNYKVYTLKDYKNLNRDMKLGGLGPSNTVAVDVAEKIRQQKLYSNVIREQNKKINRIPSVPTRSPVGSDKTNSVPRNKALEYAKTIAKPKAPQQLKKRDADKTEQESIFEQPAHFQLGVDLTQLSTFEMLRKRHEQEKQVVARFTSIHTGPLHLLSTATEKVAIALNCRTHKQKSS